MRFWCRDQRLIPISTTYSKRHGQNLERQGASKLRFRVFGLYLSHLESLLKLLTRIVSTVSTILCPASQTSRRDRSDPFGSNWKQLSISTLPASGFWLLRLCSKCCTFTWILPSLSEFKLSVCYSSFENLDQKIIFCLFICKWIVVQLAIIWSLHRDDQSIWFYKQSSRNSYRIVLSAAIDSEVQLYDSWMFNELVVEAMECFSSFGARQRCGGAGKASNFANLTSLAHWNPCSRLHVSPCIQLIIMSSLSNLLGGKTKKYGWTYILSCP